MTVCVCVFLLLCGSLSACVPLSQKSFQSIPCVTVFFGPGYVLNIRKLLRSQNYFMLVKQFSGYIPENSCNKYEIQNIGYFSLYFAP